MNPDMVVDIGNSRIKWGRCRAGAVTEARSLPTDDSDAWQRQLTEWKLNERAAWVLTGVQPGLRDCLANWLRERGQTVRILQDPGELPLRVLLERPEHVGIDRLLDAVAANSRREPSAAAVIIDAGSAVTVDLVDETGAFTGGAILPGLRLMAKALHEHTALLPLIESPAAAPPVPGTSTRAALAAGVHAGVVGGIRYLLDRYRSVLTPAPRVFLTGGDTLLLHPTFPQAEAWPLMTLEGIRLSAEALP
jgi:type III pantothenate kinase